MVNNYVHKIDIKNISGGTDSYELGLDSDHIEVDEIGTTLTDKINDIENNKADKTEIPTTLPANGGNADTVGGHTVNADVPSDAKFTDTNTWRPLGTGESDACAGNDSRLSNARPASDVSAWAKASSKPDYSWSEIGSKPSTFTPASHDHSYQTVFGNSSHSNIMLRTDDSWKGGIGWDTKSNECLALWAKNSVTRLRWYAGTDMSSMASGTMYDITPDFEISKADGVSKGYIGGTRIVTNSGSWDISVTGSAGSVAWGNVTGKPSSMPASDVYSWAKASTKPTYSASEVGALSTGNSTLNGMITLGQNDEYGMTPNTNNYCQLGRSDKKFWKIFATNCYFDKINDGTPITSSNIGSQSVNFADGSNYSNYVDARYDAAGIRTVYNWQGAQVVSNNSAFNVMSPSLQSRNWDNTAWAPCYAASYPGPSSRLIKKNIEDMTEEEAKKILDLRTVTFDYKNEENGTNCRGLIAEEVMDIIPSCITKPDDYAKTEEELNETQTNILGVDYSKLVPYLIKMVQMQEKRIQELENK